jgi:hypothetical protein
MILGALAAITAANQWSDPIDFTSAAWSPGQNALFNVSVSGTFTGTITVQRSFDGGGTWHDVGSTTIPKQFVGDCCEQGTLHRIGAKAGEFTDGTAHVRISR